MAHVVRVRRWIQTAASLLVAPGCASPGPAGPPAAHGPTEGASAELADWREIERAAPAAPTSRPGRPEPVKGPATCVGEMRCPANKPICVLTESGPECAALGSATLFATPHRQRFQCTKQSDCSGGDECESALDEVNPTFAAYCTTPPPSTRNVVCDPRNPSERGCSAKDRPKELPWFGVLHVEDPRDP